MRKCRTGQGTLEYILVLVAVLLGILAASPLIRTAIETKLFPAAQGQINAAGTAWTKLQ